MKVFFNLLKILFVLLILFLLTQNANQFVDIRLLNYYFQGVNLYIVIILCLALGAVLGAVFMALSIVQSRSELKELRRKNAQLQREVESLRNISIEDIPEEEATNE